jgi:hypothetical protein
MSQQNPFDDAIDDAADGEQTTDAESREFDAEEYLDAMSDGDKSKTIGLAATPEMHRFYLELRDDESVEVDVTQSLRDHLEKLARRHPEVFEKAMRKLEIDREY